MRLFLAASVFVTLGCGTSGTGGADVPSQGIQTPVAPKGAEPDLSFKPVLVVEEQCGEILEDLAQAREQVVIAKKAVPSSGRDSIDVVIDLIDAAAGRVADLNDEIPSEGKWKDFKLKYHSARKRWIDDLNDSLFEVVEARSAVESLADFASEERKMPYALARASFSDAETGIEVSIEALGGTVEKVDP